MDENKAMNNQNPDGAGAKTFSQDDVNRIVGERLAKERRQRGKPLLLKGNSSWPSVNCC